jgi:hypothetical protein
MAGGAGTDCDAGVGDASPQAVATRLSRLRTRPPTTTAVCRRMVVDLQRKAHAACTSAKTNQLREARRLSVGEPD